MRRTPNADPLADPIVASLVDRAVLHDVKMTLHARPELRALAFWPPAPGVVDAMRLAMQDAVGRCHSAVIVERGLAVWTSIHGAPSPFGAVSVGIA